MRETLAAKFKQIAPTRRLLGIQLNGFSHTVYYDDGTKESDISSASYSNCAPELFYKDIATNLFRGVPHNPYQNNAVEYVYVHPSKR